VEGVFLSNSSDQSDLRQRWLLAIAATIEMFYHQTSQAGPENVDATQLLQLVQSLVQRTYDLYIAHTRWSDRLERVGRLMGLERCPYTHCQQLMSAREQQPDLFRPNMYLETLFCLFYLRARVYDGMVLDALAANDENVLSRFLKARRLEWPQEICDSSDFARFKTFPLRLFGMPALMCSVNQLQVLVARNSLYDDLDV